MSAPLSWLAGPTRVLIALHLVVGVLAGFFVTLREAELAEAEDVMARCTAVEEAVVGAFVTRLSEDTEPGSLLRFGFSVPAGGRVFVSAQLWRPELPDTAPGEILTFTTSAPLDADGAYQAVDEKAKQYTTWPVAADAVVTHDASIASRACVEESRPGRKSLFR